MSGADPALRFARLTARGEAGIAIFRLRGEGVLALLGRVFRPRGAAPLGPGQLRVGEVVHRGDVVDDAVVRIQSGPDGIEVEVSVHGSLFAADRVEALLSAEGGQPLEEAERWSMGPAFGVQPGDPVVAEALRALADSYADRQVAFFLRAAEGSLSRAVLSIAGSLSALAPGADFRSIHDRLDALISRWPLGLAMARPPAVILTGRPNAGKSTLFNALLGEERVIVSSEPGTTRDLVTERFAIAGFPFTLTDGAGLRDASGTVEVLGVARARIAVAAADIVLAVIDPEADLEEQLSLVPPSAGPARQVAVVSKCDRPAAGRAMTSRLLARLRPVATSAQTGAGIAELRSRVVRASAFGGAADFRQAAPFVPPHVEALRAAAGLLGQGGSPAAAASVLRRLFGRGGP